MKYQNLETTHDNVVKTFIDDTIGRNVDIYHFMEALNSFDSACSIAINGAWGSGKTFFVKQVKLILDSCASLSASEVSASEDQEIREVWSKLQKRDRLKLQSHICIYYDAWENDQDSDPMLSLIYSIVQNVNNAPPLLKKINLTDFAEKAVSIIDYFTGNNWATLIKLIKDTTKTVTGDDILEDIRKQKSIDSTINEFFKDLIDGNADRLVIIIDELDRCRPDYAVKLLERIKHYCSDERITFVFSINKRELQHTISKYYGNDFDSCRYLDRFFDLQYELPPVDMDQYYDSIGLIDTTYTVDEVAREVSRMLDLNMRESTRYMNQVRIGLYRPTHERNYSFGNGDEYSCEFCLMYIAPLVMALKMFDSATYERFISGEDPTQLVNLFIRVQGKHDYAFNELLGGGEAYQIKEGDGDIKLVSLYDKAKEVYNAMFKNIYITTNNSNTNHRYVGRILIDQRAKDLVFRGVSLLSNFATYE